MTQQLSKRHLALAAALTILSAPLVAHAADNRPAMGEKTGVTSDMDHSDRTHMKAWSSDKDQLEHDLKTGETKAYYPKALADHGYQITSINTDKPTKVEYEVVKGAQTYEIQIAFDKATGKSTKVDVDANLWRADATKAAMRGQKVPAATAYMPGNESYSDSPHRKTWSSEKDRLEKSLALGHDKAYYTAELKKMGYQITSTNADKKDYAEYEVVKGNDSYEVQIDFDHDKAKKVDVTTNMWESDATEKALSHTKQTAQK